MITHYDMVSGEIVEQEAFDTPEQPMDKTNAMPALRLLSVDEAANQQPPSPRLPADIAMLAPEVLLARWK